MALRFVLDPELTGDLRAQIVTLWTDASNAGGAVGFVAPVNEAQVRPDADETFAGVDEGFDRLLVGLEGDRLVAMLILASNRFSLKEHWRTVKRVTRAAATKRSAGCRRHCGSHLATTVTRS